MFALLVLLSQKQDPSRNKSYNLIKRCKCVEYFFVDNVLFLDMCYLFSPSSFFDMPCGHVAYLLWVCIFFSSFFDMPFGHVVYLLWVCIFYFIIIIFILVFVVHILDGYFREKESWYVMEFYFMGGRQCLLSSSVEV